MPRLVRPLRSVALTATLSFIALLLIALPTAGQNASAARLEREAARLAETGDTTRAIESYRLLAQQFPDDRLAPGALVSAARLLIRGNQIPLADSLLETLLERYPRTVESAEAFLLRGDAKLSTAVGTEGYRDARALFRRIPLLFGREDFPQLPARSQARVRSARIGLQIGDVEGAIGELVAAIEDEPPSRWTGRARLLLGRTWLLEGEIEPALEVLQRLADDDAPAMPAATTSAASSSSGSSADSASSSAADDSDLAADMGIDTGAEADTLSSVPSDRAAARRLLAYADRHLLRPRENLPRWRDTRRWPASGLSLREPTGVAAARDGRVLVVDDELPLVALLDAEGRPTQSLALGDAARPGFVDDTPYVVTEERIVLPFDGVSLDFLQPRPGREAPLRNLRAAVRGPRGDWFVLARGWRSLLAYEGRRGGQELLSSTRPDFIDVERDALGRVYLLDEDDSRVLRMSVDRRATSPVLTGDWRRPTALALDVLGNLYVLDRGERQIHVYAPDGRRLESIGPQLQGGVELRNPVDLAVDGSGRLFIADTKLPFLVALE